jgi:hypothetical protein
MVAIEIELKPGRSGISVAGVANAARVYQPLARSMVGL